MTKKKLKKLAVMPTGRCNLDCSECTQKFFRSDFSNYQMSLEEVEILCEEMKVKGVSFKTAHVTGGEPSLWKHIVEGCLVLKRSGLFDEVEVLTNCFNPAPIVEAWSAKAVDHVVTQTANSSKEGRDRIRESVSRFSIVNMPFHWKNPESMLDKVLPAICGCDMFAFFDKKFFPCPNFYSNCVRAKLNIEQNRLWRKIDEDWLEVFSVDKLNMDSCKICLANGKVASLMIKQSKNQRRV